MPKLDLSITIITYNEERDLPRCLASLPPGAEVVVVDSHSRDNTVAIAKNYGAKVSTSTFVNFSQQKNQALQQASRDWVFSIDADEEMSTELCSWLQENFTHPTPNHSDSFMVRRQLVFMGRKIRFGRERKFYLRLFRKDKASFVGAVHEKVVITGQPTTTTARGVIYHHSYADQHDYYAKFNHFTDIFAQQSFQQGRKVPPLHVLRPLYVFLYHYILRGGFRNGYAGYCLALYAALYSFVKYAKLKELYRQATSPPAEKPAQQG